MSSSDARLDHPRLTPPPDDPSERDYELWATLYRLRDQLDATRALLTTQRLAALDRAALRLARTSGLTCGLLSSVPLTAGFLVPGLARSLDFARPAELSRLATVPTIVGTLALLALAVIGRPRPGRRVSSAPRRLWPPLAVAATLGCVGLPFTPALPLPGVPALTWVMVALGLTGLGLAANSALSVAVSQAAPAPVRARVDAVQERFWIGSLAALVLATTALSGRSRDAWPGLPWWGVPLLAAGAALAVAGVALPRVLTRTRQAFADVVALDGPVGFQTGAGPARPNGRSLTPVQAMALTCVGVNTITAIDPQLAVLLGQHGLPPVWSGVLTLSLLVPLLLSFLHRRRLTSGDQPAYALALAAVNAAAVAGLVLAYSGALGEVGWRAIGAAAYPLVEATTTLQLMTAWHVALGDAQATLTQHARISALRLACGVLAATVTTVAFAGSERAVVTVAAVASAAGLGLALRFAAGPRGRHRAARRSWARTRSRRLDA